MTDTEKTIPTPFELTKALHRLREEHRDLSDAISALESLGRVDQLQIRRLKRQKLLLKERIIRLEDQLTPDIIA
ncbi:MAG: YdcH family protein [Hyphomicrobiales bacterium]